MRFLSALIADNTAGRMTTGGVHANCNAVGKMLRIAELEARYGVTDEANKRVLNFIVEAAPPTNVVAHSAPFSARERALAKLTPEERAALVS